MTTQKELHDAIAHVGRVTGDPAAWTRGLSPQDIAVAGSVLAPQSEVAAVLANLRAQHPTLFGVPAQPMPAQPVPALPGPAVPASPPHDESGGPQAGAGVTAIRKAEDDLAHQNSRTAQVDLLVITAILNAHTTSQLGRGALDRLQADIDDAVRARTDLDTPAGARDFQRYLIGKLREIAAVVETATLDDRSKATLATAWTALYEASKAAGDLPARPSPESVVATSPQSSAGPAADPPLLPYGAELGPDPLLDALMAQDPFTQGAAVPTPAAATAAPAMPGLGLPAMSGPGLPAMPAGSPAGGLPLPTSWPRADESPSLATNSMPSRDLDDLLAEAEAVLADEPTPAESDSEDDPAADEAGPEPEDDEEPEQEPDQPSAEVRLPNGDLITAPNPQLATVINAALGGTPIGEAFHRNGLTIPPPGTAVQDPVDPADVGTGDVGMFTDRQALALDRTRALLGGEIQPLTSVSGPSFLGWMHPPQPAAEQPAITRPATTPSDAIPSE